MIFKKPEPATNGDNGKPQTRSRLQSVLDDMMTAQQAAANAASTLSSMSFDMQRFSDSMQKSRDSFIRTIEGAGGDVEQASIEEQIRDYIPKAIQRERADEAN